MKISKRRRLDALSVTGKVATEIERSDSRARLKKAVQRLDASKAQRKRLEVPNQNLDLAKEVAQETASGNLTLTNLAGTKRRFVRRKKK